MSAGPRVLYYAHDSIGLGHIQRTLYIARELARVRPDVGHLILTSALRVEPHALPATFDYVRLPPLALQALYVDADSGPSSGVQWHGLWAIREALIQATADAYAPDLVLVDDAPAGLERELARALACLRAAPRRPRLVAGLKQFIDTPEDQRRYWDDFGVYELLDEVYDDILLYGDPAVWDTPAAYAFSPAALAKMRWTGYVVSGEAPRPAAETRAALGVGARPLALVAVGGGADGARIIDGYLQAVRLLGDAAPRSFVITGPLLDERRRAALERAAAAAPRVTLASFVPDLLSYIEAADLMVTMGGDSLSVPISRGKRTIVIPRERPHREQLMRAEAFAARGLARLLRVNELSPALLAREIVEALAGPPPAPSGLRFDGARESAALLAELLP